MERRRGFVIGIVAALIVVLVGLAAALVWREKSPWAAREYVEVPVQKMVESSGTGVKRESMGETVEDTAGKTSVGDAVSDNAADNDGAARSASEAEITAEMVETTEETIADVEPPEDIVLLFGGDVYLSNHVLNAYENAGGIHGVLDEGLRQEIEQADIFMVNQEFPFTDRGTAAADKQYTFRLPPEKVSMFHEMGIDIVTLANNHILDFGEVGLLDSCETLDNAGILYVGGGPDLERARKLETITVGDKTIGFLGTSRVYMAASWAAGANHPGVFSTYDPTLPLEAIKEAKDQCDYLVVYVHWGVERETTPKEYQRVMGRQYIDAGADLVVGSHPHVLQDMEYYNGKPIVYSLGNFVFGSSIPKTALLKVELSGGDWTEEEQSDYVKTTMIPCTSSAGYTRLVQQ